jgi:hypothetical protein
MNDLPNSLEGWTELYLVETFKLSKNPELRAMVAKELEKRIALKETYLTT